MSEKWIAGNLEEMADQALPRVRAIERRPMPLTLDEQVARFKAGVEVRRLHSGEITPEQFQEYVRHFREKVGVNRG